eukprot:249628_1
MNDNGSVVQDQWKKWKDIKEHYNMYYSKPFVNKENNIIFVTEYSKRYEEYGGICMYDEKEDKVKLIQQYPNDKRQKNTFSCCYDSNTNKIFIVDCDGEGVIIYDM